MNLSSYRNGLDACRLAIVRFQGFAFLWQNDQENNQHITGPARHSKL